MRIIVKSVFILICALSIVMVANAMGVFEKNNAKQYREYRLMGYLGDRFLIPVQTSLALAFEEHPELKSTVIEDIIPLPKMMDPRGERKKESKLGPYIYFKSLQNIPLNFANAVQVLRNGGSSEGCEGALYDDFFKLLIKDGKGCILLDVHDFVLNQPIFLNAIRDGLNNPSKYVKEKNKDSWVQYNYSMIELSGGSDALLHTYFRQHIKKDQEEDKRRIKERLENEFQRALNSKQREGFLSMGYPPKFIPLLYVLRFINNDGNVTHIEYFEPHLKQGE